MTTSVETWPALALSVLLAAAAGVLYGLLTRREWSSLLLTVATLTLAIGVGGAMRMLWSRSRPAARTLDLQPPLQRPD